MKPKWLKQLKPGYKGTHIGFADFIAQERSFVFLCIFLIPGFTNPFPFAIIEEGMCLELPNLKDWIYQIRQNRWNKSNHSCRQISSEVVGKPPQFIN
ncbi:hypothetical protein ACTXT7_000344 [Hymenolepis weldensis]